MKERFINGMIKTLSNLLQQDKEKYRVPRRVQDVIPIRRIWPDGIFLVGSKVILRKFVRTTNKV